MQASHWQNTKIGQVKNQENMSFSERFLRNLYYTNTLDVSPEKTSTIKLKRKKNKYLVLYLLKLP